MSESIDVQPYLHAIRQHYERWWEFYTVTDAEGRERLKVLEKPASPFDFELTVQTVAGTDGGDGEWVGCTVVVEV